MNHLNSINNPKAELHIHLEGSLEPQMILDLAKRNNIQIKYSSLAEFAKAYQFNNLQEFLDLYYLGMSVLQTERDYFDLTYAYLTRAHQDNVTHSEMFFDPQAHLERGISLDIIMSGLWRAIVQAKADYGINASLIPCFLRHLSEDNALSVFDDLMNYRDKIIGIGLDSSELGNPPVKFKNLFNLARKEQLKLLAHAGEEGPVSYVWDALDILGVDRIDHGNAILSDHALIKRIATDKIALTMCPLSNRCLRVVPDLSKHQAIELLNHDVCVTINSDDPAYFGGYINQNYIELASALNLTDVEINKLTENSLTAKFI
ncbi:MAG: adenosine deaminase [Burkholderiales bacterium]|nr:adenosine deaminase [Burkholderiales bacterium]